MWRKIYPKIQSRWRKPLRDGSHPWLPDSVSYCLTYWIHHVWQPSPQWPNNCRIVNGSGLRSSSKMYLLMWYVWLCIRSGIYLVVVHLDYGVVWPLVYWSYWSICYSERIQTIIRKANEALRLHGFNHWSKMIWKEETVWMVWSSCCWLFGLWLCSRIWSNAKKEAAGSVAWVARVQIPAHRPLRWCNAIAKTTPVSFPIKRDLWEIRVFRSPRLGWWSVYSSWFIS